MPLRVRHSYKARQDFRDIWEFIAADNDKAADEMLRTLNAKITLIAQHPEIGRQRTELGSIVRSVPLGRYIIFYRTDEGTHHVVRVVSSYRNVTPDMLAD